LFKPGASVPDPDPVDDPPDPPGPPAPLPLPAPPVSEGPTTRTLVSVVSEPSLLVRTIVLVVLVFPVGALVVVAFLPPEVLVPFLPGEEVTVEFAPEVLVEAVELVLGLPVPVVFAVLVPVGRRVVGFALPLLVMFVDTAGEVVVELPCAVASTGRRVRKTAART